MELNINIQMYRRVTQRTAVKMTAATSYDASKRFWLHHLVGNMHHIEFESLLKCPITKKKKIRKHIEKKPRIMTVTPLDWEFQQLVGKK